MKKVLLTGAAGFIGSHLAEALIYQGAHLRAFLHYNSRGDPGLLRHLDPTLYKEIEIISGDLADTDAVYKAVRGCDTVFHLGGLTSIPYAYHHPQQVISANVNGTLNVLLACREATIERLLHTSAGEVYGSARTIPIPEDHPLQGQSPYAASKISADKLAESFYCSYGLPVVTLRPFSVYGPRQSARALIPALITQALTCPEIHPGSLETCRDYTYVTDIVAGFIKAAQTPGIEGHVYNLGSGQEVTTEHLLQIILDLASQYGLATRPAIVTNTRRSNSIQRGYSGIRRLLSDNTRAQQELGWAPVTSLPDGLRHTIAWVSAHLDFCRSTISET
jgi:dTDP-glucose 4,6-dehydratase